MRPSDLSSTPTKPLQASYCCDLNSHKLLCISELVAQCQQALQAHSLLISWFGRKAQADEPAGVFVTAVLLPPGQALQVLRGHAEPGQSYPSLTPQFPAAQIFERELWEQTGLMPEGHPWLKPVRFEGADQNQMGDYPFFKVRGQEVHEVGVGPIHAGVIEPGHFRFMCHGEQVQHLEIQLGYQHRGVETLLLKKPPQRLTPLVESIVGDSVIAYAWAFNAALENMANRPAAPATQASRAIGLELERIAMHLATLTGLATDIAYLQPAGSYQRLRTAIINASQRACGNRFGKGWIRPGAAAPLDTALRQDLLKTLRDFLPDFQQVNALMAASRSVQARFQGVGTVSTQTARELGLTGVVARASGLQLDVRHALPEGLYASDPVQPLAQASGDCWARMCQRMNEAQASAQWLIARLSDSALDLTQTPVPFAPPSSTGTEETSAKPPTDWTLPPKVLSLALVEGVRGPVLVALESGEQGQLIHVKVQDPSLANWFGLAYALREQAISDFPICNKSFDLSYCGNDL